MEQEITTTQDEIKNMLDLLDEFYAQQFALGQRKLDAHKQIEDDRQRKIRAAIPPEIAEILAKIDQEAQAEVEMAEVEFSGQESAVAENITKLEAAAKRAVLDHGATVKGAHLQAVWTKPRTTWDTAKLEGYAAAHPEIITFRKIGEASVSIRKIG